MKSAVVLPATASAAAADDDRATPPEATQPVAARDLVVDAGSRFLPPGGPGDGPPRVELRIAEEDDVMHVRRTIRALAKERGFDAFASAAVTTATSELARNVLVHGNGGRVCVDEVRDGDRRGLRAEFRDEGPGIADVPRALAGGAGTAASLGLGLSGSRRLVDELSIDTEPGLGTAVAFVKWNRRYLGPSGSAP